MRLGTLLGPADIEILFWCEAGELEERDGSLFEKEF
jgi:hypothetical protein